MQKLFEIILDKISKQVPEKGWLGGEIAPIAGLGFRSEIEFDQQKFLRLLAGCISISKDRKFKIIASISLSLITEEKLETLINALENEVEILEELVATHGREIIAQDEEKACVEWVELYFDLMEKCNDPEWINSNGNKS